MTATPKSILKKTSALFGRVAAALIGLASPERAAASPTAALTVAANANANANGGCGRRDAGDSTLADPRHCPTGTPAERGERTRHTNAVADSEQSRADLAGPASASAPSAAAAPADSASCTVASVASTAVPSAKLLMASLDRRILELERMAEAKSAQRRASRKGACLDACLDSGADSGSQADVAADVLRELDQRVAQRVANGDMPALTAAAATPAREGYVR